MATSWAVQLDATCLRGLSCMQPHRQSLNGPVTLPMHTQRGCMPSSRGSPASCNQGHALPGFTTLTVVVAFVEALAAAVAPAGAQNTQDALQSACLPYALLCIQWCLLSRPSPLPVLSEVMWRPAPEHQHKHNARDMLRCAKMVLRQRQGASRCT